MVTILNKRKNKRLSKNYAMIYFKDKKPLKKTYESVTMAFYDYENKGCIYIELFTPYGVKLASYPNSHKES
jgi:hypothetical protein